MASGGYSPRCMGGDTQMIPTWGRTYWPIAMIIVSLLFLPAEIIALVTNAANTLSDYSWYELHLRPGLSVHTVAWYLSFIGWLLFVVVITWHIWFRSQL